MIFCEVCYKHITEKDEYLAKHSKDIFGYYLCFECMRKLYQNGGLSWELSPQFNEDFFIHLTKEELENVAKQHSKGLQEVYKEARARYGG